jgi:tRNA (uracil-5-)-methyltransferase
VAKSSEELIKTLDWPLFDKTTLKGFWRFVVVRISKKTNEMVIHFVGNRKYFESQEAFEAEFKEKFVEPLAERLRQRADFNRVVKGITFQHAETSNDSIPYVEDDQITLFHGDSKTYSEVICGCTFEVSNSSFLQINIAQSEQMYAYAAQCAGLDDQTILLDICSGIGTIGISMGKSCRKVVGIEMVRSACQNALKNAAANQMSEKYEVVEGKVEDKIEEVAAKYSAQGFKIVGIIDPPRAGLHPDVVRTLRTCKGLDDLIFICCDIKQSKANIIELCLPQNKKRRGPPFSPLFCTGFDMFPHTPHFESLFVLRRLYEELQ